MAVVERCSGCWLFLNLPYRPPLLAFDRRQVVCTLPSSAPSAILERHAFNTSFLFSLFLPCLVCMHACYSVSVCIYFLLPAAIVLFTLSFYSITLLLLQLSMILFVVPWLWL
jgi:hypothetical protein